MWCSSSTRVAASHGRAWCATLIVLAALCCGPSFATINATWLPRPVNPGGWSGIRPTAVGLSEQQFLLVDMYLATHAIYSATAHAILHAAPTQWVSRRSGFSLTPFHSLGVVVAYGGDDSTNPSVCGPLDTRLLVSAVGDGSKGLAPWTPLRFGGRVADAPACRLFHAAAAHGRNLYIHGGYAPNAAMWLSELTAMSDLWVLDIAAALAAESADGSGSSAPFWRRLPSSLYPRFRHTLLSIPHHSNRLYAVGGIVHGEQERRIESFEPPEAAVTHSPAGHSRLPVNASFWAVFPYTHQARLSEQVMAVYALPHRLVIVGAANSSGAATVIDMTGHRVVETSVALGPLISGTLATFAVVDNITGRVLRTAVKVFETVEMSQVPFVLNMPATPVSCDPLRNEVESDFGDRCSVCRAGSAADGLTQCTACSLPFHTVSAARQQFCPSSGDGNRVEYVVIAVIVVVTLVPALVAVHVLLLRDKREKPRLQHVVRSGTTPNKERGAAATGGGDHSSDSGTILHLLGFAIDNDVNLWLHTPEKMSAFTSAMFAEVRSIVERNDIHEVHNTGDHGILVADANSQALLLDVAQLLVEASRRLKHEIFSKIPKEETSLRIVLNTGPCDWRYNNKDSLIVSGIGAIAIFDLMGRIPSGRIVATEEFVACNRKLQEAGPPPSTAGVSELSFASDAGSVPESSFSHAFTAEPLQARFRGRKIFRLSARTSKVASAGISENSFIRADVVTPHPSTGARSDVVVPDIAGEGVESNSFLDHSVNEDDAAAPVSADGIVTPTSSDGKKPFHAVNPSVNAHHPLVSAGVLSTEQVTLLLVLVEHLFASMIVSLATPAAHSPLAAETNLSDETTLVHEAVLDVLRVNHSRGRQSAVASSLTASFLAAQAQSTPPVVDATPSTASGSCDQLEMDVVLADGRTPYAAFRLLEIVDMMQTKDIAAALHAHHPDGAM